jgi:hypothetical protein
MTENEKAKAWREAHSLSVAELGAMIGYSSASIWFFEAGKTPPRTYKGRRTPERKGRAIHPKVWLRYKAACAGIDAYLVDKRRFDW